MASRVASESRYLDWGIAEATHPGERESGDLAVVRSIERGVLVAVVDGLGHGPPAAAAARKAAAVLSEPWPGDSVVTLLHRCHQELRGTRGAVMSIAAFDVTESTMTSIGIGNVTGMLIRAERRTERPVESVLMRAGVVGLRLPRLQSNRTAVWPGDVLIMVTDGIDADIREMLSAARRPPQELADLIMSRHRKGTDDATVLVARYRPGDPP